MKVLTTLFVVLVLLLLGPLVTLAGGGIRLDGDWRTASREPAGIAPDPSKHPEAIVQVYVARAFNWRGIFGVHSWISVKPKNAAGFTNYEVMGWHVRHGGDALSVSDRAPDARWYGAMPEIIADLRGADAATAIAKILAAVEAYPYRREYRVWPGPNSNTFTAYVARRVPELRLDLPPTAIGKDYLPDGGIFARAPSGTGFQISLFGLVGFLAAIEEGIEINLLALTTGFDFLDLALKLPGFGRLGLIPAAD